MRAVQMQYAVPGWGVGELWTLDGVVLAHELEFTPVSDTGLVRDADVTQGDASDQDGQQGVISTFDAVASCGQIGAVLAQDRLDTIRCLTPEALVARLTAFLQGEDVSLADVPIDLTWCTPFQHRIAVTLRAVPRGEVVSYGELAALAGNPGAARAAGTFCARNRFMLIVPCHRVVAAGGIGGYGSAGAGVKSRLLALEGVRL